MPAGRIKVSMMLRKTLRLLIGITIGAAFLAVHQIILDAVAGVQDIPSALAYTSAATVLPIVFLLIVLRLWQRPGAPHLSRRQDAREMSKHQQLNPDDGKSLNSNWFGGVLLRLMGAVWMFLGWVNIYLGSGTEFWLVEPEAVILLTKFLPPMMGAAVFLAGIPKRLHVTSDLLAILRGRNITAYLFWDEVTDVTVMPRNSDTPDLVIRGECRTTALPGGLFSRVRSALCPDVEIRVPSDIPDAERIHKSIREYAGQTLR